MCSAAGPQQVAQKVILDLKQEDGQVHTKQQEAETCAD